MYDWGDPSGSEVRVLRGPLGLLVRPALARASNPPDGTNPAFPGSVLHLAFNPPSPHANTFATIVASGSNGPQPDDGLGNDGDYFILTLYAARPVHDQLSLPDSQERAAGKRLRDLRVLDIPR